MTRRTRFIAGLCTLLALTFSLAESVWASTCAMPMTGSRVEVHEASEEMPSDVHCATHEGHDGERNRPGDSPCPFSSGLAAQACAGVTSLPATMAVLPFAASEAVGGQFMIEVHPGLLFEASLFRPPRA